MPIYSRLLCHRGLLLARNQTSRTYRQDSLAERSKAVAQGAIPQGRGFEPHSCQYAEKYECHV